MRRPMSATASRPRLELLEDRATPALIGGLDHSFGSGGLATLSGTGGEFEAVAVQPDGKIVAVGFVNVAASQNAYLAARFNPDGTPDTSFGTRGD